MTKCRVAEFKWEHGLSLKNLKRIIYDKSKGVWLSPKYIHSFTKVDLGRAFDLGIDVYTHLNLIKPSRVLI